MEDRIDLKRFLSILKKRMLLIILTTACIFVVTVFATIYIIKPTYEATEYILVDNTKKEEGGYEEVQRINMLLASSIDFITSPIVLNSVKKEFNIKGDKLEENIAIKNNNNSQIINIVIRDSDPDLTKELAHSIAVTSVKKLNQSLKVGSIQVLNDIEGEVSPKRIDSPLLNMAIGLTVGLFISISLAMVREHLDDSIKNPKEVDNMLSLPILGYINLKAKKRDSQWEKEVIREKNRGEMGA
ncbi:YveK family protein [Metabacillus fastidiosus]|uniref:Wzz/FepE/Etk N-terminal domain-containing protein n=1 Tax=Metabacillus fastidiosus TaxID=1458 RepID=A0ABU6NZW3_9BACI|nr:Wzz/FepE/Etk N-terminal domain-containing protein [Metabacillus fastidiosus]MED4401396.1 Wzz/FepE/Etk N-terminal domain-containing protein [Metabacillus fastidiosus]MED4463032.1 Wzz/FepE/Etk N-terminal domain-containing protein [Metabacillus fastidiosus]